MSLRSAARTTRPVEYPTSDGKPMAETDLHREDMFDLIETLKVRFADDPMACVSGNILLYYEEGNKHVHVSPDVLVVFGIARRLRDYYLLWEEGKGPDCVIEVSSKSTKKNDLEKKFSLYRDVLKVREYFLFDPRSEYLDPPLQGYRLVRSKYVPIESAAGRLPSQVLGLHLEKSGTELRLHDPAAGAWLPTPREALRDETRARLAAEAENERLRRELDALRRRRDR
jgi:Uma2 family endonuclease